MATWKLIESLYSRQSTSEADNTQSAPWSLATPTLSRPRKKVSETKLKNADLPEHPDLQFARKELKAQKLDQLLPKVKVEEGPHKAGHCRVVCGTFDDDGTPSEAWMFVRKGGGGKSWTAAFEKDPHRENLPKGQNSLKPGDVKFFKYLRLEIWCPEDGVHRRQGSKTGDAEILWKEFLVQVHRLAVPTDEHKYHLKEEEYKKFEKQKTTRGKKRKRAKKTVENYGDEIDSDNVEDDEVAKCEASRSKFSKLFPHLAEPYQIWDAYNLDQVDFNLLHEDICAAIQVAWCENCDAVGRMPLSNEVLLHARAEKRNGRLQRCEDTRAYKLWEIKQRSGAETVELVEWNIPPTKLWADMREGKAQSSLMTRPSSILPTSVFGCSCAIVEQRRDCKIPKDGAKGIALLPFPAMRYGFRFGRRW